MSPPSLRDQLARQCKHFTGRQNDTCKAGVRYVDVMDASHPGPYRWPCLTLHGKEAATSCAQRCMRTEAEAETEAAEILEYLLEVDRIFRGKHD